MMGKANVVCISIVFNSSLGEDARVTFVVGLVAADSVACGGGSTGGDDDSARNKTTGAKLKN
jgi:hypothetical protein